MKPSKLRKLAHRVQMRAEQPRVLVATPMQDTCLAVYCRSVVRMLGHCITSGLIVAHEIAQYSMLPLSRNLLAQLAIDGGFTHLLFIDSDMEFPADLAVRMVAHRKPIMAINCMARRRPYYLTARDESAQEVETGPESTGIERVARVGTGIMLIHLDVFREMAEPWFEYRWLPEKHVFAGEDFVFCDKARTAGNEIWIDHDLSKQVAHVGTFQFNPLIRAGFREVEHETQAAAASAQTVEPKGAAHA